MFAAGKAVSGAAPTDAQFNYVTMLLHGDGTNGAQNNTFVDSSTNNFSITRNGNTTQGTFSPYGSNWSNYFNGSSSLSISSSNTVLPTGTQDFSVELWVNWQTQSGSYPQIISNPTTSGFQIYYDVSAGALAVGIFNVANVITYTIAQSALVGVWTHIAVTRSGTTFRLFVNGVLQANGINVISFASPTTQYIASDGSRPYTGYISNVRTVLGSIPTAYQTSSTTNGTSVFTPSTTPLTAVSGTALLTCADNRFIDDSTNAFAITANGSPSVQRFSPFSPTSTYSTSVIGGSAYFDGTGDYLQTPSNSAFNFSATDCTLEFWYYGAGSSGLVFEFGSSTPDTAAMQCEFSSGTLTFKPIGASSSFFAIQKNAWNYIAAVKTGTTYYLYINGTRNTSSTGTAASSSQIINIGARNGGSVAPITGYLSDFRVSNTARYTAATMTVPTTPSTAITNTSLLLNTTNAGILDNAMMNDLETVGNAQISTSVKKYGTGSIAFDGSGDYLKPNMATPDLYAFGSGDFTIEFWGYILQTTPEQMFIDWRPAGTQTTQPLIYVTGSGVLAYYVNAANRITGATLSTGQWYHIAVCRSGTSTKMFLNGTQTGSTWTDTTVYTNVAGRPVIGLDGNTTNSGYLNGYIDDLRITKGVARYTANFSVPTASFPDKG